MALHGPEYQTMPSGGNSALVLVPGTTCGRLMPHDSVVRAGASCVPLRCSWACWPGVRPVPASGLGAVSELEDPAPWLFGYEMIRTTRSPFPI